VDQFTNLFFYLFLENVHHQLTDQFNDQPIYKHTLFLVCAVFTVLLSFC